MKVRYMWAVPTNAKGSGFCSSMQVGRRRQVKLLWGVETVHRNFTNIELWEYWFQLILSVMNKYKMRTTKRKSWQSQKFHKPKEPSTRQKKVKHIIWVKNINQIMLGTLKLVIPHKQQTCRCSDIFFFSKNDDRRTSGIGIINLRMFCHAVSKWLFTY